MIVDNNTTPKVLYNYPFWKTFQNDKIFKLLIINILKIFLENFISTMSAKSSMIVRIMLLFALRIFSSDRRDAARRVIKHNTHRLIR